ncbi:GIY-YIG nuclease family protein [bacterium]|nr:GIY-YIG nuclease family protein [bacterium]
MTHYVYIVECSDGTYYCGYTNNLNSRIKVHNYSKTGAKYTKSRRPVKLVYSEELRSKTQAMKREAEIKRLTRGKKKMLVLSNKG